ncbi:MAG TPA: serine/threonine-protein kinase, partial [Ktedonobacteraceae bacterium]|nr:serine/threonine-protein kinase [Ktedonobacteraceae bacterium]
MQVSVGKTLGPYRLDALLGRGGMGEVFRGTHLPLNRNVALKIMLPHFAALSEFRARFLREARTAASLRHQHIVAIDDFNEQDDLLYLVMELMSDGSLSALLHRYHGQPLPLQLALHLAYQAAEGLAAAHELQAIHRDIKPDNLLLQRIGGKDQPERYILKISDFG